MSIECQILYTEGTKAREAIDSVYVQLRVWSNYETSDAVMETFVQVDGKRESHDLYVWSPYGRTEAEMIREAIQTYDEMVTTHPNLPFPA